MPTLTSRITRIIAIIWLIIALGGSVFSIFLIGKTWSLQSDLIDQGRTLIDQGINLIDSLDEGLEVINQALENINNSLEDLGDSTALIQETVHNTASMSGSFKVMLSEDFTVMTKNTLIAIQSTEKTAGVIDGTLYALSRVPLIGIPYNPETSLSSALGNIATEMEDMPEMLEELSVSMESTSENLYDLETEISDVSTSLDSMQETLGHAIVLVGDYQQYTQNAQTNLEQLSIKIGSYVNTALWIITLLILVMLNGAIAAILQAWKIAFPKK